MVLYDKLQKVNIAIRTMGPMSVRLADSTRCSTP